VGRVREARLLGVLAVVMGLVGAAVGCARDQGATTGDTVRAANVGGVSSDEPPKLGGKLVFGLSAETNGWNPASNQWASSGLDVARAVFDTLAAYDEHSDVQPYLAERFSHNADYTEWTIHLRPDVVLHNGRPVTSEVVARNQRYLMGSPITKNAYVLIDSITEDGPLAVKVKMREPWTTYPNALATQIGVVADPDWMESNDGLHPIGTGPFVFHEWQIGSKLVAKKNPRYWRFDQHGNRMPYLDEIEFQVLTDAGSRTAGLDAGQLDVIQITDPDLIRNFQERADESRLQVFANTGGENVELFVQLNTLAPPFDDPDARRALAYATDRRQLIDDLGAGLYEPASGPFAPGSRWYSENEYPDHDPAKAAELVERVKSRNGGRFEFDLLGAPNPENSRQLQYLQQMWARAGITATIRTMEQATLIVSVITGRYQATTWTQFDSPHPIGDAVWWNPETVTPVGEFSLNFARNRNPRIATLLHEANQAPDAAVRDERYREVARLLAIDVPYVWLYHTQQAIVARNRVVNVTNGALPGGQKGLPMTQGSIATVQIWLRGTG
jgi:peptide/nickel transport system substrate-binding protein